MQFLKFLLTIAAVATISANRVSYEGYNVYRFTPKSASQVDYLKSLEGQGINFWKFCSVPGRSCDALISPIEHVKIMKEISEMGITQSIFIDDVERLVKNDINNVGTGRLSWDRYYRFDEIEAFVLESAENHSSIAQVIKIGESYEQRNMNVIKISKSQTQKPIVLVEANAHAREFITSAVATYLINELLNSEDPDVQKWTEDYDWYVLPVLNPDGLEYCHTDDRMWRKNRAPTSSPTCLGVDLNRNFDYNWCEAGASPSPCQITYCGSSPESEPEAAAWANFSRNLSGNVVFYLSIHSYSQFVMFPFGDRVDNTFYDTNMLIATQAANALEARHGTKFQPGNWMEILYVSTGDSMDWAKSKLSANLSLTYELRDEGQYGFVLPADQVLPSSEEFVDSLKPIFDALTNGVI